MDALKVTLTVKIEALHIDAMPGLLLQVNEALHNGIESGVHNMDDGDSITWSVLRKPVSF